MKVVYFYQKNRLYDFIVLFHLVGAVRKFLNLEALVNDDLSTDGEGLGDGLDGASYNNF